MKQKLIALGLVGSPLALAGICVVSTLFICMLGWLFSSPESQSRLIRVVQIAPLATPVGGDVLEVEPGVPPSESGVDSASLAPEAAPGQPVVVDAGEPLTQEQVNEARGFVLPEGSVNTITQEGVATRLVVPKMGIDSPITLSPIENQTWKVDHLGADKIGHLEGTAPPGSNSNIVLAAHVTVSTGVYGPFASLSQLEPGDSVYVYYGADVFEYVIDDLNIVDRTAVQVTHPSDSGRVTLITCSNWSSDEGRYLERLVVGGYFKG